MLGFAVKCRILNTLFFIFNKMKYLDKFKSAGKAFMDAFNSFDSKADGASIASDTSGDATFVEDKPVDKVEDVPVVSIPDAGVKDVSSVDDAKASSAVDTVPDAETDGEIAEPIAKPDSEPQCKIDVDKPEVRLMTSLDLKNGGYITGFSIQGRSHIMMQTPCQDYHAFEDLGDGWLLAITSDGAGSAREAARGSKGNCELATRLVKQLVAERKWKENNYLPTELEWHVEIKNVLEVMQAIITRSAASKVDSYKKEQEENLAMLEKQEQNEIVAETKMGLRKKIDALKESMKTPLEARDFNATIILLLISPQGMMTAHIGDGRMGYLGEDGKWKALMTPHKGDEASSTVFVPNNWNRQFEVPVFRMSDVFLPETRVIKEKPKAFVLMSDGCESFSWTCKVYDKEKNYYYDLNEPFERFLNPLIDAIGCVEDKEQRVNDMIDIVNVGTVGGRREQDDRTMLLGVLV